MLEMFPVAIFFYASAFGILIVAVVWLVQYGFLLRLAVPSDRS